jgi:hypothetical protein
LDFSKRKIKVNGTEIEFNVKTHFPVGDVSDDMKDVSSLIAWWGSVWAAAEAERINVDAFYRAWRARTGEKFLGEDPKLSVDKLKNKIEAHPEFLKCKEAMAMAEENVTLSKTAVAALEKKGNMLQSLGAVHREERRTAGMSTPAQPKSAPPRGAPVEDDDDEEDDEAAPEAAPIDEAKVTGGEAKMKAAFKGKPKKAMKEEE